MQSLTVQPLIVSQSRAAYPLIREVVPTVDFKTWSRFVRRTANPRFANRSGIMVALIESRPYPSGLVAYKRDEDLRYGNVLTADHFIAFDLLDRQPIASALIAAMESMGRDLGCDTIRWNLHHKAAGVASHLLSVGHQLGGTVLYKPVGNDETRPAPEA
ncbi:MAG: hypothetical protein P4L76_18465 [Beijerinckiaceae bacterium]|nr:hypothetical protein [Beijerinckiaceae bacterium]